jgi:hypothetical protein
MGEALASGVSGRVDHDPAALIWRDVFIPSTVVESDGFTAEVGGTVSMALELHCQYWTAASDCYRPGPVAVHPGTYRGADVSSVHELVGVAVATENVWVTGWVLDVAGLLLYVDQALRPQGPGAAGSKVHRNPTSRTGIPAPGSAVRARERWVWPSTTLRPVSSRRRHCCKARPALGRCGA